MKLFRQVILKNELLYYARNEVKMKSKLSVLYVSDSLGTPIHPRGIFNYSVALIEVMKSLGLEVTLMVEGHADYGFSSAKAGKLAKQSNKIVDVLRLAEMLRYFNNAPSIKWFSYANRYGHLWLGGLLAKLLLGINGALTQVSEGLFRRVQLKVRNHHELIDFVPPKVNHLTLPDSFIVGSKIYSASMQAGANGFVPVEVDATGYDLVVVDTPHFVKLNGISQSRILTVVHDLIPLQDPTMSADWRYLFVKKLEATMAMNGTMIFVSETTRDQFFQYFEKRRAMPNYVIYPPIRSKLMKSALTARSSAKKSSIDALQQAAHFDVKTGGDIDWTLPFFVTPTSDEPRKNIAVLIKAFEILRLKANLIVIGEVNADIYINPPKQKGEPKKDVRVGIVPLLKNIHFTGYISDTEKNLLIAQSAGLIFPSFAEGFGIPIIEGAIFNKPVICSDIKVFREITADHAVYFDPHEPEELAKAVIDTIEFPDETSRRASSLFAFVLSQFSQSAMATRFKQLLAETGIEATREMID